MDVTTSVLVARMTSDELAHILQHGRVVILQPVGAIEPHGPHLPLDTDLIISRSAATRAVPLLAKHDISALVAPDIPYGVTLCARDFAGAAGVSAEALAAYLAQAIDGWIRAGVAHVCVVNNHLEPAHDHAVRAAAAGFQERASVASPLTRRWARTLSDEFKRGACHAGEYETAIVLAASADDVRESIRRTLPEVDISLSEKLDAGIDTFRAMGLERAYAGAPARASRAHGEEMLDRLAEMVAREVLDAVRAT